MNTSHERLTIGSKTEWLTPPEIIRALGPFDLDPCAPVNPPWPTADVMYNIEENGLLKNWFGRVWCNPPYGKEADGFLRKMSAHGHGTALLFARTDTKYMQPIMESADMVFFVRDRINFYHVDGRRGGRAGAPSMFLVWGDRDVKRLMSSGISGTPFKPYYK